MLENCKIIELTSEDKQLHQRSIDLRFAVWIYELKAPVDCEIEHEDESIHFLLTFEGKDIATARFRLMDEGYKIERVSVLKEYRKNGIGAFQINHVIKRAQEVRANKQGKEKIVVHGTTDALGFWEKLGFIMHGELFEEEGFMHRHFYYNETIC